MTPDGAAGRSARTPDSRSRTAPRPRRSPATSADTSAAVNDGKTYRGDQREPPVPRAWIRMLPPSCRRKADTLFKGETLRSILLNAYGWWTVATIALFAGYAMVASGIVLGVLAILGFRHAKRAEAARNEAPSTTDQKVLVDA